MSDGFLSRPGFDAPLRFRLFYHSVISDWNNGHAHFLRGYARELIAEGHDVVIYEPADGWSVQNLVSESGPGALDDFFVRFPCIPVVRYDADLDLEAVLKDADIVIVHEWTPPEMVAALGRARAENDQVRLLFHDTHHRAVTAPAEMARYDLGNYDGVLVFGEVLRDIYIERGWAARVWTWHEAADLRVFYPRPVTKKEFDLVWIGNWGDEERSAELQEFLIEPLAKLGLKAAIFGVRYPEEALAALKNAGISFRGRLANDSVPELFARARVTVHVPRRPYAESLPGIPTIRPFEAMACGIPLLSGPWTDAENLFEAGRDFLFARDGREMKALLERVLSDEELAASLAARGLATIRERHSCAHRVSELLAICETLTLAEA